MGARLAKAAFNTIFGGKAPYTGPTLAGCTYGSGSDGGNRSGNAAAAGATLTIQFDEAMLRGDKVAVQGYGTPNFTPYYHG